MSGATIVSTLAGVFRCRRRRCHICNGRDTTDPHGGDMWAKIPQGSAVKAKPS